MRIPKPAGWNRYCTMVTIILLLIAAATLGHAGSDEAARLILTPEPGPAPRINGPKVYGARPGHPFVYRIPCTGVRPIRFSAEGLPPSLRLDSSTGIISGNVPEHRGEYAITLHATNEKGSSGRAFKLVVGDTLALTPPMGWNDWYTYYDRITEKVIREAADAMIASGMADFGYAYVDIDGCWTMKPGSTNPALSGPPRDAAGHASSESSVQRHEGAHGLYSRQGAESGHLFVAGSRGLRGLRHIVGS